MHKSDQKKGGRIAVEVDRGKSLGKKIEVIIR